jgi:hypothetical protein
LAFAAITADRSVINPFPAPPEITPVVVLTLIPAPLTGKSLVLVGLNVTARAVTPQTTKDNPKSFFAIENFIIVEI